jgi:hypothetical protein
VLESCNFGYKPHLSQPGVPHPQNFEIWKFLYKLRSEKISKSVENFQKMLDGSKFGKRCIWESLFRFFSDLKNSKFSLRKS